MCNRIVSIAICVTCGLLQAAGGCGLSGTDRGSGEGDAVFISGVERLVPPAVTEADLYKPALTFLVDPADPASGRAIGFFLHLATGSPGRVEMRLLGGEGTAPVLLHRISAVPPDSFASTGDWDLPDEARGVLRGGRGVFWIVNNADGDGLEHRAAVVLPDTWPPPSVTLEVYASTSEAGDPLRADRIELARDFFYMAVIGDSVAWGNGLRESQKFSRLVAAEIQRRTGRRVVLQVHAISGARIVPDPADVVCRIQCNGEAQTATTSITAQADLLNAPEMLELILMNGCTNDIGVLAILNTDTQEDALIEATHRFCHDEMLALLRKVRSTAPTAKIVVTGYYQIVSLESRLPELAQFIFAAGAPDDPAGLGVFEELAGQSRIFWETAEPALAEAVRQANAESTEPAHVIFVDPAFGLENALFAPQSLLWGLTADRIRQEAANEGLTLFPEDPMADLRSTGCFNNDLVDPITCLYASVGHPNVAGARRYADRIISALEGLGLIPPVYSP